MTNYRIKVACCAVLVLISMALGLTGCIQVLPPKPKFYPFSVKELTEVMHEYKPVTVLSVAVGKFIEEEIGKSIDGVLDYSMSDKVDFTGTLYDLNLKLHYDLDAELVGGINQSFAFSVETQKDGLSITKIGIENNTFFAERRGGNGELERFENSPSFLVEMLSTSIDGATDFIAQLKLLLGFVTFEPDSTHYGKKMESGVEVSELTLSTNMFSSLSSLLKAIVFLKITDLNTKYPININDGKLNAENESRRKREADIFKAKVNEVTQFLFKKDYERLSELPTMYLNLNVIMHSGMATNVVLSVSATPKFIGTIK